ncbi:pyruvate oxidase [Methanococcoides vulcani]|uniref:Pyruvate oxidase n=2 Tax=Methanococcoides vulcani TaxID=1353158 RepID=A0A1H9ZFU0_9EURY|nr:pyruvate oxidase [Methanococcoides vulcani]
MGKYKCSVCNWTYDEEAEGQDFDSLPDTYTCPVCGAPKSAFVKEGGAKEDQDIKTTVADKIVEQLEAFGVRYVYGIPGDSNLPLIDAIRRSENIRFILTRHEETAAFMASAHGKMTSELGVCISIAGPGCTNLITGLMDAATDRSCVLAFAGQVPEVYLGSEAFQEIDQIELFKPFTEFAETIARDNQALKLLTTAVKYAHRKPGVSVLSTPTDILAEKLGEKIYLPEKRVFMNKTSPKEEDVLRAAELINGCKKVTLFAGWGSRHSKELLLEMSRKIKAPIATTSRAKGVIHETERFSVGVLGSIGSKHSAQAIKDSDLIVIIGSGFRQANLVPTGIKIIQIDIDPTKIGKTFDVDVGIVGDADLVLKELLPHINEREENKEFLENIDRMKKTHREELETDANDLSIPINPGYVVQAIKRHANKDAIICVDVGDHTYWFYKKFVCEGQRTFMSANIASMGFALPASLSAKLDYPDKQVICVTGDGGFGMLMGDFTTAVREELGINVIVFNDGKLKNIKKEQLRDNYPEYGVTFPNPDFAGFARSAGGEGYRIEDPAQLDDALEKAFSSEKAALIDVVVDPDKTAASTKRVD